MEKISVLIRDRINMDKIEKQSIYGIVINGRILLFLLLAILLSFQTNAQTINLDLLLTGEEINWLKEHEDSIRYAPNPSWPPGDYIENGIHKGIVSDYIKLFEEKLGIKFQKMYFENWSDMLNGLKNSEVDLVGGVHTTENREQYFSLTDPFIEIKLGILVRSDYPHRLTGNHINKMILACVKGYSTIQHVRNKYPNVKINRVNDDFEALTQTSYGLTDGTIIDFMSAGYLAEKYHIANLKLGIKLNYHWNLGFASRKNMPELASIINKLFDTISEEQKKDIYKKWVSYEFKPEPGFFERNQKAIIIITFLIISLLFILVVFNYSLKRQVNKKIRQLEVAKDIARKHARKYKLIAENTSDVIWMSDLNLKTTYVSPSVKQMLGEKPEEHLKRTIEEKFPHKYAIKLQKILKQELEKEKNPNCDKNRSVFIELQHYRSDGSTIWVNMNVSFIRDRSGNPMGLYGITRDITYQKKAEKYIKKRLILEKMLSKISKIAIRSTSNEKTFNRILKMAGETMGVSCSYIFEYNRQNNTVTNTYEWCAEGITPRKEILKNISLNDIPWFWKKLYSGNVIGYKNIERIPDEYAKKILRSQGILSIIIIPLFLNNDFYGFIGFDECTRHRKWHKENIKVLQSLAYIVTSLIKRHRTEEELRIKDLSIESSMIAIVLADLDGTLTYVNKKFLNYWRYNSIEDVRNKKKYEFWKSGKEYLKVVRTIQEKGHWYGEMEAVRSDGSVFIAEVNANIVTDKNNKLLCLQFSFIDITERKRRKKELIIAKKKAEESNRLKTAFLSNMSHEIRTPLNGILGFLEIIKDVNLSNEEQEEFINLIKRSGNRLIETINDIIEMSKIESGGITIHDKEVDLIEMMQFQLNFFKPQAEEKNLILKWNRNPEISHLALITDKYKVETILSNLLKNAIKFTEKGHIEFGVYNSGEYINFYVKDTGQGIPESRKNIIFDRFRQSEPYLARSHEGSGLGLAISKAYAELLGGEIWFKNNKEKGVTFFFSIPYKVPDKYITGKIVKAGSKYDYNFLSGHKILIAEDDKNSFIYFENILKRCGAEVFHTRTGEDTVKFIIDNPDISMVIMDIIMPKMDGIEATRKIRALNIDIPIIAQTASVSDELHLEALEAGCNDIIVKPIEKNILLRAINDSCLKRKQ
jgi:PAS domain S-box-containing protein